MSKAYLYMRGQAKESQRAKLQEEFPAGEIVIDRNPPETLERLIAEAGPGDLIATVNFNDMPEVSVEDYITLCRNGAGLHFQQQPHLDSAVFCRSLAGEPAEAATAAAILQRQLDIEAARQAQQRAKEKAGRGAAAAAGRKGGRRPGEKQTTKKEIYMKEAIGNLMKQGLNGVQMLERLNDNPDGFYISLNTLYKYIKELKAQDVQEAEEAQAGDDQTGAAVPISAGDARSSE